MVTTIKFAKVREGAIIPSFGREGDGCMDVYACSKQDIIIQPHEVKLVPTGICSTFDKNYRISLRERGSNTKSTLITMAGQIDSNYTGEWFVALYNGNDIPIELTHNVKEVYKCEDYISVPMSKAICQCAVEEIPQVNIEEVELDYIKNLNTNRGSDCLGSSGK